MRAVAEDYISEEEYVRLEHDSVTKHEYFNGCVYAMAGGTPTHIQIAFSLATTIGPRLRGRPCRGFGSDQRVKVEATGLFTYPDTLIVCPPQRYAATDRNSLVNPQVIFEVLSRTTERYDRTDKFEHYKQIPSLTDYVLIEQVRVRVEHFQRGVSDGWTQRSYHQRDQCIALAELDLELPLDEIYDGLDLPTGLFLLPDPGLTAEES